MGQTDRRTPDRCITLTDKLGQRNKGVQHSIRLQRTDCGSSRRDDYLLRIMCGRNLYAVTLMSSVGEPSICYCGCTEQDPAARVLSIRCFCGLRIFRDVILLPRDAMLAQCMLSSCVRPSVTSRCIFQDG